MNTAKPVKRVNVRMTEENWRLLKSQAAVKGMTLENYINEVFVKLIETAGRKMGVDTTGPIPEVVSTAVPAGSMTQQETPVDDIEDMMGRCVNCQRFKELQLVTFLDNDQIRQTGKMCTDCVMRARMSGRLIE